MTNRRAKLSHILVCALVVAAAPAFAAGTFDGTWVVDVPSGGPLSGGDEALCPALRFTVAIKDSHVTGTLTRVPTRTGGVVVETGTSNVSAPVTGTVQPDGTVAADWLNYHAAGKLTAKDGVATIKGECGPRQATLVRVQ
jgi:hypothetical protein